ncbi:hypothetical protein KAR91_53740 [Candidatus Pacearchaeota archaeon]|nr:hypothetical protein [Candidatus Pacearchaeota archaeon]
MGKTWTEKEVRDLEPHINKLRLITLGIPEEKHKDVRALVVKIIWKVSSEGGFSPFEITGS